jgi:hypothetical protein
MPNRIKNKYVFRFTPPFTHMNYQLEIIMIWLPQKKVMNVLKDMKHTWSFWGTFYNKQLSHNSSFRWIAYLRQGPNHNIRFSSICYEMIIHIIRTLFLHSLNTINMWINGISCHWCQKLQPLKLHHYGPISTCVTIAMEFESQSERVHLCLAKKIWTCHFSKQEFWH